MHQESATNVNRYSQGKGGRGDKVEKEFFSENKRKVQEAPATIFHSLFVGREEKEKKSERRV